MLKRAGAAARRAVQLYALARIAQAQAEDLAVGAEAHLTGSRVTKAGTGRPWQSFQNAISEAPEKLVSAPVTVAVDVGFALIELLAALAARASRAGPARENLLASCAEGSDTPSRAVAFLSTVCGAAKPVIRQGDFGREFEFSVAFTGYVNQFAPSAIDPGAHALAGMFLDLLRLVGWSAGGFAYEKAPFTLNRPALSAIVRNLQAPGLSAAPLIALLRWPETKAPALPALPAPARAPAGEAKGGSRPVTSPGPKRPVNTVPAGQGPPRTLPGPASPVKTGEAKALPGPTTPAKTGEARTLPGPATPAKTGEAKTLPGPATPAKTGEAKAGPGSGPAKASEAKAGPAPTKTEPTGSALPEEPAGSLASSQAAQEAPVVGGAGSALDPDYIPTEEEVFGNDVIVEEVAGDGVYEDEYTDASESL
ncbi:MAG TPA: hypothetical protein VNI01_09875 [Elusimicrobiota bacterium]|nr:hypothetical protein [Elusimicrobiota bacterium]